MRTKLLAQLAMVYSVLSSYVFYTTGFYGLTNCTGPAELSHENTVYLMNRLTILFGANAF